MPRPARPAGAGRTREGGRGGRESGAGGPKGASPVRRTQHCGDACVPPGADGQVVGSAPAPLESGHEQACRRTQKWVRAVPPDHLFRWLHIGAALRRRPASPGGRVSLLLPLPSPPPPVPATHPPVLARPPPSVSPVPGRPEAHFRIPIANSREALLARASRAEQFAWLLEAPTWLVEAPTWLLERPTWLLDAPTWLAAGPAWLVERPAWLFARPTWTQLRPPRPAARPPPRPPPLAPVARPAVARAFSQPGPLPAARTPAGGNSTLVVPVHRSVEPGHRGARRQWGRRSPPTAVRAPVSVDRREEAVSAGCHGRASPARALPLPPLPPSLSASSACRGRRILPVLPALPVHRSGTEQVACNARDQTVPWQSRLGLCHGFASIAALSHERRAWQSRLGSEVRKAGRAALPRHLAPPSPHSPRLLRAHIERFAHKPCAPAGNFRTPRRFFFLLIPQRLASTWQPQTSRTLRTSTDVAPLWVETPRWGAPVGGSKAPEGFRPDDNI